MEKIIYFDYCALAVFVILTISVLARRMTKGRLNRNYLVLLGVCVLSSSADVLCIYLDNQLAGYVELSYLFHTLYLITHNLSTLLYVYYLITLTDTWRSYQRIHGVLFWTPWGISVVCLIVNLFYPFVFRIEANGAYVRGQFFFLLYVFAFSYVFAGFVILMKYRHYFTLRKFASLFSIFPLMLGAVIFQVFHASIPVEMFANALSLMFISMMIQSPEETMDFVTGFSNLSKYMNDMELAFRNHKYERVIMLNIKNYETIRTMIGYSGYTKLMKSLADRIESVNQKENSGAELYNLGDGKFRCIIGPSYFSNCDATAKRLFEELREPFQVNGLSVELSTAVCIARIPQDISDLEALLAFGNDLFNIKTNGGVLHTEELFKDNQYHIIRRIDYIIDNALRNHNLEVFYQPIYDVKTKTFRSAEALLRLIDDEYGFVPPDVFIPAAEQNGTIHQIGNFVLEEVCKFIASQEFVKLGVDYIEVNLSVVQCMNPDLAGDVLKIMEKYKVRPDQINLEITETAASYSQNTMMDNMDKLAKEGIQFSLDDFGTGYSNMTRIATLPFQLIKIDKSLSNLDENARIRVVIENMIQMIKAMDMEIVVEGVETEEMAKTFSNLECEYIQGYFFSKPLRKKEYIQFVSNKNEMLQKARK